MIFDLFLKALYSLFLALMDKFKPRNAVNEFNKYANTNLVIAKTGGGKTAWSIAHALELKQRFKKMLIISNVESPIVDLPLTVSNITKQYDVPCLVIIDEANSTFPASLKSLVPEALRSFLPQVRKGQGKRILVLTQDYKMLDANFRRLAHNVIELTTFWGRLQRARVYLQTEYEHHHTDGGVRVAKDNNKMIKRQAFWHVQTDKVRNLYDYKALVKVDWLFD